MRVFVLFICLFVSSFAVAQNVEVIGVLRNNSGTWEAIDNSGHSPVNIESVSATTSGITVNFTFTASKVRTFIVGVDETYAGMGYVCGASAGFDNAIIKCAVSGTYINHIIDSQVPYSNLWIYGVFDDGQ